MRSRAVSILVAGVLAVLSMPAMAAKLSLGGYLETVSIASDVALQEGVEDSAWGFGVEASTILNDWFEISGGLGIIEYDDNEAFVQAVEGSGLFNNGDLSVESSDATGLMAFVEMGPRYTLVEDRLISMVKFGVAYLDSDRSIPYCSDCYEENIDIEGGPYVKLGLGLLISRVELGLAYTSYTGDEGLESTVRLSLRTRY